MGSVIDKRKALADLASAQYGLFTAKQAEEIGYKREHFAEYVKSGQWESESHGLYRLTSYPVTPEQEYMKWFLWSRNKDGVPQAAFSYETALFLYEITDLLPTKMHLTVPRDFRRSSIPKILAIHRKNLMPSEVVERKGIMVTTPVVTLDQIASDLSISLAVKREAIAAALDSGLVTKSELLERLETTKNSKFSKLLKDLEIEQAS